jgi:hypothetical protein
MKLGVCWIWGSPFVWTRSVESMLGLRHPAGVEVSFFRGNGWGPAKRHINACEKAMAWGADLILILGADQVYDSDLLERLVARIQEGCEVIAAMVPTRGYLGWEDMKPFQKMAWRIKSRGLAPIPWDGQVMEVVKPDAGDLQRIDLIGSGCILFRREHLEALAKPWFYETIDHATQNRTASMDTKFCYRLHAEAYAQVWVDTTIDIRHLHAMEIDGTYSERFPDWTIPGVGPSDVCQFERPIETAAAEPADPALR